MSTLPSESSEQPVNAPPPRKRSQLGVGILILVICIPLILLGRTGLAFLAASHKGQVGETIVPSVQYVSLEETQVEAGLTFTAFVKELRKAELSFRVPGTVESLCQVETPDHRFRDLHEGDQFSEGTILAQLDTGDFKRELDNALTRQSSAESRVKQAKVDYQLAVLTHARTTKLSESRAASEADMEQVDAMMLTAQVAIEVAERDLTSAQISAKQAEMNLEYCSLKSPFPESTIAVRSLDPFQRVAPGQPAFTVMDLSSMVIAFGVQDTLLASIGLGDTVEVSAEATGSSRFNGVIHKISSTADPLTRSYVIEVRIDEPGQLKPGMIATAHFRHPNRAVLLPLTSIAENEQTKQTSVYRLAEVDGKLIAQLVPITIGDVLDNRIVVKLSDSPETGLQAHDRVIKTGVHRLRDGMNVKLFD